MRKDHEFGLSIRAIAEKRGVHRRTVRQALASAVPPERKVPQRRSPVMTDEFLGGVFVRMRFDNLTQAVARVVSGERRIEQDRFIAFRSHYLFESSFTSPGIEGAHEKGGIENEVGRFRRRWLTPVPSVSSWAELNDYLRACCIRDLNRSLPGARVPVGAAAGLEPKRSGKPGRYFSVLNCDSE